MWIVKKETWFLQPVSYLPGHSSQYDGWQQTKEDEAFWNKAEVSNAPGGHDLIQTTSTWRMGPPGILAVGQLSVEAPNCDQQNYVADGPEKAEEAEARDHQIPKLQVAKLSKTKTIYKFIK